MLTSALSLPISQYYYVKMAAISGIYSKRVYFVDFVPRLELLTLFRNFLGIFGKYEIVQNELF